MVPHTAERWQLTLGLEEMATESEIMEVRESHLCIAVLGTDEGPEFGDG